jgi:hypothetical protein
MWYLKRFFVVSPLLFGLKSYAKAAKKCAFDSFIPILIFFFLFLRFQLLNWTFFFLFLLFNQRCDVEPFSFDHARKKSHAIKTKLIIDQFFWSLFNKTKSKFLYFSDIYLHFNLVWHPSEKVKFFASNKFLTPSISFYQK